MSTIEILANVYRNVMRLPASATLPSDVAAQIDVMAKGIEATRNGEAKTGWTLESAAQAVIEHAYATTGVAVMTYGFMTNTTLTTTGLDFLVAADGPNPNNLNSETYARFDLVNRCINFAVNLADQSDLLKSLAGLGMKEAFAVVYAKLDRYQPMADGWSFSPDLPQKTDAEIAALANLLDEQVSNGHGGTYSRLDYLREVAGGGDLNTKAAMMGWLMAEFMKAGAGPYVEAVDTYLREVGVGVPPTENDQFYRTYTYDSPHSPYGEAFVGLPGEQVKFEKDWNVVALRSAADDHLLATDGDDVIIDTDGLAAGHRIEAGGGNDLIKVTHGPMKGLIDAGSGNDKIVVSQLDGQITTGTGHDIIEVQGFGPLHNNGIVPGVIPWAVVTDFDARFDQLVFTADLGAGAKIEVVTPAVYPPPSLDSVLEYVSSVTKAGENSVFEYGRNTYIYHQNDIRGVDAGDGLIMLENATGLTVGLVGPASDSKADIVFGSAPTPG